MRFSERVQVSRILSRAFLQVRYDYARVKLENASRYVWGRAGYDPSHDNMTLSFIAPKLARTSPDSVCNGVEPPDVK